jgi:hypothetical protein
LVEGVAAIWEWTVEDQTPPETTILSGPAAEIGLGTPAVFVFASNELGATFECSLDGAAFAACAAPPDNSAEFLEAAARTWRSRWISLNVDTAPVWLDGRRAAARQSCQGRCLRPHDHRGHGHLPSPKSVWRDIRVRSSTGSFTPCTSPVVYTG